jgi:hypothetical protein
VRFTKTAEEAEHDHRSTGGGNFIKYLKDGDQTLRILEEPEAWKYYWEHFNPSGFPFPCTDQKDCPGCNSDMEKMKKVQRRVAFNAWDGQYHNVWKIPNTVAEKLKVRYQRLGTIIDRDYTITRIKTGQGDNARWDYDIEGGQKEATDAEVEEMIDPEDLLVQAYEDAWGSSKVVERATSPRVNTAVQSEDPPSEPKPEQDSQGEGEAEVTEMELRKMTAVQLRKFCKDHDMEAPPEFLRNRDGIVDWMMAQSE